MVHEEILALKAETAEADMLAGEAFEKMRDNPSAKRNSARPY